jgi:hypothetical protein
MIQQIQNTSILDSLVCIFIFWPGLVHAGMARPGQKIKIPSFRKGSILVLRREGDSNPRYSYPYGSLANCWFKPLTHLSFLSSATKIGKHGLTSKSVDTYFNPLRMSMISLKFSRVSSSKSLTAISPDLTLLRNLLITKFLGTSLSLT